MQEVIFSKGNLRLVAVVAILCLIGFGGPLWGQARQAALTGIVKDTQGAVVPGADIAVSNEATGVSVSTVSNDVGLYRFDILEFGVYTIECSLPGFKTFEQAGVTLRRGQTARIDITLEVGEVTERVTVTGEAPLLRTESTEGVSETVTNRQVNYLPNLSRYWDSFVTLSALISTAKGGIYQPAWGHSYHRVGGEGWVGFYMNGSGAGVGNAGISPSQGFFSEFVEEFQLVFNSFSSEYTGSYVTVITTKSGANDFHGSFNYFILDDGLNALPWGATEQQPFRETQWGFSGSGPIWKDRMHFYGAYQREFFESFLPSFLTIPSQAMIGGDFSAPGLETIYDPDTHRPDPNNPGQFLRDPFPGNKIPADRIDPVAANMAGFWPAPNQPGVVSGNFRAEGRTSETNPQFNMRLDHRFNERHSLSVAWTRTDWTADNDSQYGRTGVYAQGAGWFSKIDAWVTMNTANYTYVPNPNWVVELTYGVNSYEWGTRDNPGFNIGLIDQIGLKSESGLRDLFPLVNVAGYNGFDGGNRNTIFPQGRHTFQQRAIHYAGRHVIKFGAETQQNFQDLSFWGTCCTLDFGETPTAAWDVAPIAGTGNSIASFLLGRLDSANITNSPSWQARYWIPALYVEDQVKVADNFTVNFGARFERFGEHTIHTHAGESIHQRLDVNAINPVSGTPGVILYGGETTRDAMNPPFNNVWPRAGFAWQPWGAGTKTVIRGAVGMFSDWTHHNAAFACGVAEGRLGSFSTLDQGVTPAFFLVDGFPAVTGSGRIKGPGCGAVAQNPDGTWSPNFGVNYLDDKDIDRGQTIQANFGIQQEIPGQIVIDLVYMTLQGRHMGPETFQENQVHPSLWGPGITQADRPFPQYTSVARTVSNANTKFHAANIKVEKRYSNGLNFTSDYIFQKSLNNSDPWERYDSGAAWRMRDMQHRWVSHWIYDLPWGPGRKWANSGVLGHIAGPWIVSGIYRVESGEWLDQTYNTDTTNGFIGGNQGVDLVGSPNLSVDQRTRARWFNTDAFAAPPAFRMGNAGRTLVEGPGFWNVDLAIYRQFMFHEDFMGQFNVEFANLFNHPYNLNPGVSLGSPSFGIINGKAGNRRVQLGFRLMF